VCVCVCLRLVLGAFICAFKCVLFGACFDGSIYGLCKIDMHTNYFIVLVWVLLFGFISFFLLFPNWVIYAVPLPLLGAGLWYGFRSWLLSIFCVSFAGLYDLLFISICFASLKCYIDIYFLCFRR
jgi:hypothetical protein